jgi:hypothetical protein
MTPAEVLTEIKQCLIQDGMIATEEAAQSYVNSRESINDELQESLRSRLVQDKTEFFN